MAQMSEMSKRRAYRLPSKPEDTLRVKVLDALAEAGWLKPTELYVRADFPVTASPWSYLRRLYRWGLVKKRTVTGIGQEWTITKRGRERLAWLMSQERIA